MRDLGQDSVKSASGARKILESTAKDRCLPFFPGTFKSRARMTSLRTAPRSFVDCGIRCASSISMGSVASRDAIAVRKPYREVTLGWTVTASNVLQL